MRPRRLLIENVERVYTFDRRRTVYGPASLLIEDGRIESITPGGEISRPGSGTQTLDGQGRILLPGLVNVHHHFFQNVTRAIPTIRGTLLEWLRFAYPLWAGIDEETVYHAARISVAELLLTGCTTVADFFYLYPRGQETLFAVEVDAVRSLGIRFHGIRGCNPIVGGNLAADLSEIGIDPRELTEERGQLRSASERAIEAFHDPSPGAMVRVGIGPHLPVWDRPEIMRDLRRISTEAAVLLHTHLHPLQHERVLCQHLHGTDPLNYLWSIGWLGPDVWIAHASEHTAEDVDVLARTGTAVVHCPTSLMALGRRVPPVRGMLANGVRVGLGTDGGASNDSGSMLAELRMTMLIHRLKQVHEDGDSSDWLSAEDVFALATNHGASILGRDDIGSIEVGKRADLILIDTRKVGFGGMQDPLEAVLHSAATSSIVDTTIVDGNVVVSGGRLQTARESDIVEGANLAARRLVARARARTGISYPAPRPGHPGADRQGDRGTRRSQVTP